MSREACPHCGDLLIEPCGPIGGTILVIGDAPDWLDVTTGVPFYDKDKTVSGYSRKRPGNILREELMRAGLDPRRVRYTNLWLHAKKKKNECDVNFHITRMFQEFVKAEYVLVAGIEPLQVILDDPKASTMDWSGLELKSPNIPKNIKVMAMVKAATGFDTLGEIRLALGRFADNVHAD